MLEDCQVTDVSTVREFVETYYKNSRLRGRGDDYAESVIASHEAYFEKHGYDLISRHESRMGELVSFFGHLKVGRAYSSTRKEK